MKKHTPSRKAPSLTRLFSRSKYLQKHRAPPRPQSPRPEAEAAAVKPADKLWQPPPFMPHTAPPLTDLPQPEAGHSKELALSRSESSDTSGIVSPPPRNGGFAASQTPLGSSLVLASKGERFSGESHAVLHPTPFLEDGRSPPTSPPAVYNDNSMSDEVDMMADESVGSEQLAAGLEVPAPLDLVSSATGTKPVRDGQEAERSRAHLLLGRQTSHAGASTSAAQDAGLSAFRKPSRLSQVPRVVPTKGAPTRLIAPHELQPAKPPAPGRGGGRGRVPNLKKRPTDPAMSVGPLVSAKLPAKESSSAKPAKRAAKKVATAAALTRPSAKQGSTATDMAKPAPQRAAKAKPSKVKQPTPKEAANLAVRAAFQRPVRSGSGKEGSGQPSLPAVQAKSAGQGTPVIQAKTQAQAKPAVQTRPANEADTIVQVKGPEDGQAGREARGRAAGKWFALSDEDEPPAGKKAEDTSRPKSSARIDKDQRGEADDVHEPASKRQKTVSKEDEDAGEEASQPGSIDEQVYSVSSESDSESEEEDRKADGGKKERIWSRLTKQQHRWFLTNQGKLVEGQEQEFARVAALVAQEQLAYMQHAWSQPPANPAAHTCIPSLAAVYQDAAAADRRVVRQHPQHWRLQALLKLDASEPVPMAHLYNCVSKAPARLFRCPQDGTQLLQLASQEAVQQPPQAGAPRPATCSADALIRSMLAEQGSWMACDAEVLEALAAAVQPVPAGRAGCDIPVTISQADPGSDAMMVYLDVPLPPRAVNAREGLERVYARALRSIGTTSATHPRGTANGEAMEGVKCDSQDGVSHDVWRCGGRKLVVRAQTALAMEPGDDVDRLLRSELIGPQEKTVPWRSNGAVVLGVKVDFLWDDTAAKEQFSAREKALWCTQLSLRPGAHLLVARVAPHSRVLLGARLCTPAQAAELPAGPDFNPGRCAATLHALLDRISQLTPGRYHIRMDPGEAVASLFKAVPAPAGHTRVAPMPSVPSQANAATVYDLWAAYDSTTPLDSQQVSSVPVEWRQDRKKVPQIPFTFPPFRSRRSNRRPARVVAPDVWASEHHGADWDEGLEARESLAAQEAAARRMAEDLDL